MTAGDTVRVSHGGENLRVELPRRTGKYPQWFCEWQGAMLSLEIKKEDRPCQCGMQCECVYNWWQYLQNEFLFDSIFTQTWKILPFANAADLQHALWGFDLIQIPSVCILINAHRDLCHGPRPLRPSSRPCISEGGKYFFDF